MNNTVIYIDNKNTILITLNNLIFFLNVYKMNKYISIIEETKNIYTKLSNYL